MYFPVNLNSMDSVFRLSKKCKHITGKTGHNIFESFQGVCSLSDFKFAKYQALPILCDMMPYKLMNQLTNHKLIDFD